jgi:long-chain acyl-CoA synthetase
VEKIENICCKSPFVSQIFVYGDSLQACLVAIVVPDAEYLCSWAVTAGIRTDGSDADFAGLCVNPRVVAAVMEDITAECKAAQLLPYEMVKALKISPIAFRVENNLLTPTFKLKRSEAETAYRADIKELYSAAGQGVAGIAKLRMEKQ